MKRGIISLLQVHFQEDYSTPSTSQSHDSYEYSVPEVDVTGDCVINYTVHPNNDDDLFRYTVIKTKDPKECTKKTATMNCLLPGVGCEAMSEKYKSKSRTTVTMAVQDSDNDVYRTQVIKEVNLEEYFVFDHNIDESTDLWMTVNSTIRQRLLMVGASPAESSFAETPVEWIKLGLTSQPTTLQKLGKLPALHKISFPVFDKLMRQYIREIRRKGQGNSNVPRIFMELVKELRQSNVTTLLNMYEKYSKTDVISRNLFNEVLSNLDTPVAVKLMASQIISNLMDEDHARRCLRGIALATSSDAAMISDVLVIARTMPSLKDQALLTLGSMIYNFLAYRNMEEDAAPEVVQEAKQFLVSFFQTSLSKNDEHDILLAIKGLMNAGLSSTLPLLMNCATNCPTLETRATAIYSPWKVSPDEITPKVINRLALLFENITNPIEIRVASFVMLMETKPSMEVVNRMTPALNAEDRTDIFEFMCSYIHTTKGSYLHFAGHEDRINVYEEVLRRLDKECPTEVNKLTTSFSSSLAIGREAVLDSHVLYDPSSRLPREVMLNLVSMNDVMGFQTDLFEIGLRSEGLEQLLTALSKGTNNGGRSNLEFLMKMTSDREDKTREKKCNDAIIKPKLSFYALILGQEVYFTHKDVQAVAEFLAELQREKTIFYNETSELYYSTISIPTSIGFPFTAKIDKGSRVTVNATGKLDLKDSRLALQLNSSFWQYTEGEIAFDGYFVSSGVKYNASSGFKQVSFNVSTSFAATQMDSTVRIANVNEFQYEKKYNFSSFLRHASTQEECTKLVEFRNHPEESCVAVSGFEAFDKVCKTTDVTTGLNVTYHLEQSTDRSKQVGHTHQSNAEVDPMSSQSFSENGYTKKGACVSIGASEWSDCYSELQCGQGEQYRTHQIRCDEPSTECTSMTETRTCTHQVCDGKMQPLTKIYEDLVCQSVNEVLTCPKPCEPSRHHLVDIVFKCTPYAKNSKEGNDSAVRIVKTTSIPEECVCSQKPLDSTF
ncbi:vitellogenin-like [Glandiceps talaboti]